MISNTWWTPHTIDVYCNQDDQYWSGFSIELQGDGQCNREASRFALHALNLSSRVTVWWLKSKDHDVVSISPVILVALWIFFYFSSSCLHYQLLSSFHYLKRPARHWSRPPFTHHTFRHNLLTHNPSSSMYIYKQILSHTCICHFFFTQPQSFRSFQTFYHLPTTLHVNCRHTIHLLHCISKNIKKSIYSSSLTLLAPF